MPSYIRTISKGETLGIKVTDRVVTKCLKGEISDFFEKCAIPVNDSTYYLLDNYYVDGKVVDEPEHDDALFHIFKKGEVNIILSKNQVIKETSTKTGSKYVIVFKSLTMLSEVSGSKSTDNARYYESGIYMFYIQNGKVFYTTDVDEKDTIKVGQVEKPAFVERAIERDTNTISNSRNLDILKRQTMMEISRLHGELAKYYQNYAKLYEE